MTATQGGKGLAQSHSVFRVGVPGQVPSPAHGWPPRRMSPALGSDLLLLPGPGRSPPSGVSSLPPAAVASLFVCPPPVITSKAPTPSPGRTLSLGRGLGRPGRRAEHLQGICRPGPPYLLVCRLPCEFHNVGQRVRAGEGAWVVLERSGLSSGLFQS